MDLNSEENQGLEDIQRRATKYILNDFKMDYKSRLEALSMLPPMHRLEINTIMPVKAPREHLNI